jgi:dihydrofolate reductase
MERALTTGGDAFMNTSRVDFVTDGIEAALDQAKSAAGGKDVSLGGGAQVATQYLAAGMLDEMVISIVPLILGDGARLSWGSATPGRSSSSIRWSKRQGLRTSGTC